MAISKYNVITHNLSGKVGDLLLFRNRFGRTIVGKIPVHTSEPTVKQLEVRTKFKAASNYAKIALKNPPVAELYAQRKGNGISSYNLAIADFFSAPVIVDVITDADTGAVGSSIVVQATDDTKVKSVFVIIFTADNTFFEQGYAMENASGGGWVYTATRANASLAGCKIHVTAMDLPGNEAEVEKVL